MAFRRAPHRGRRTLTAPAMCDPADLSKVRKLPGDPLAVRARRRLLTGASVSSASATAHAASAAGDGASDVAKLHQLFDAAVANGMPQLVCHYVDEVCGHDDFSSPDGVEAYLQDGEMVAEWASEAFRRVQALDQAAALRTSRAPRTRSTAPAPSSRRSETSSLRSARTPPRAATAPRRPRRGDVATAGAADTLQAAGSEAARWRTTTPRGGCSTPRRSPGRCARDSSPAPRRCWDRYVWAPRSGRRRLPFGEPRRRRRRRRRTYRPTPTAAGSSSTIYSRAWACTRRRTRSSPRRRLRRGCSFFTGSAAPAALVAKQSLFLYYLLDAGLPPDGAPSRGSASHVRLGDAAFVETRCAALLDDHSRGSSLELAVRPAPRRFAPPVCHSGSSRRSRRGNRRMRSPSPRHLAF